MSGRGLGRDRPDVRAPRPAVLELTSYENEIVAAEAVGDLGLHVALEHTTASIAGAGRRGTYVLRATNDLPA